MMRYFLLLLTSVLLLTGCGYNPEDPVYDTAANPEDFPAAALALIDGIESGQLGDYDAIINTFSELYVQHTDLLDNEAWREIIQHLGAKFRYIADRHAEGGIRSFLSACQYYRLAAFARVGDDRVRHRAEVFDTWWQALESGALDASLLDSAGPTLTAALAGTRFFALGDTLHREFFGGHLREALNSALKKAGYLKASTFDRLPEHDRALLAFAGFDVADPITKLASFDKPRLDLITLHISRIDSTLYGIEAYFLPQEQIKEDLRLVLRIETRGADTLHPDFSRDLHFSHVELVPEPPPATWTPLRLAAMRTTFDFTATPGRIHAGLAMHSVDGIDYVPLSGSGHTLVELDTISIEIR